MKRLYTAAPLLLLLLLLLLLSMAGSALAEDWTVRADGVGPLRVGMDFDTVNRVLDDHLQRAPLALQGSRACFYVSPAAEPRVGLMFVKDVLQRVDVQETGVASDRGIRVGDPVADVAQRYGDALHTAPSVENPAEKYLTVPSADSRHAIRFETRQGTVATFYAGAWEQVQYVEGCQ
ncbi:hypothetical protein IP91_03273 [Pseudoduganella lurida]|uniref:Uncharacterized protein n=1 Tax=Pseudoduganella lurida TaxID=1036180 RepID=A0A562R7W0_9BURK|nr:hypothetical protein [Pseudoduganella lurida]TWI64500.1 hypothetical protein IP91_03273 [Pseudoduganella lurida]